MATEQGVLLGAAYAVAPSLVASAVQVGFAVSPFDYVTATMMATLGIVARHCHEASKSGTFKLKFLAFDIPTAPMLGITAFAACAYFLPLAAPIFTHATVIGVGFIGPEAVRKAWELIVDIASNRARQP